MIIWQPAFSCRITTWSIAWSSAALSSADPIVPSAKASLACNGIVKLSCGWQSRPMTSEPPRYRGYRFLPEIISHAVWLYHRFGLSFRDVEDLLAERGVTDQNRNAEAGFGLRMSMRPPPFSCVRRTNSGSSESRWCNPLTSVIPATAAALRSS